MSDSDFEGYISAKPISAVSRQTGEPLFQILKMTDFGDKRCKRKACDIRAKQKFRGKAVMEFLVTQHEGAILHEDRSHLN